MIKIACERTVLKTGRVSFPYADSILRQWRDAGVKDAAGIQELDKAFAARKSQNVQANQPAQTTQKPKQNRFINYTQSEWDFAELERLEREQREKW